MRVPLRIDPELFAQTLKVRSYAAQPVRIRIGIPAARVVSGKVLELNLQCVTVGARDGFRVLLAKLRRRTEILHCLRAR